MKKIGTDELKTEIIAGATTFLATVYIIIVNPAILAKTGMPFPALVTATVMVTVLSTLLMGLYGKNPIVLAPGMGLNAFFTFSVVLGMKIPWQTALGTIFWAGIIFLLLSIFNIRTKIVKAIPRSLRLSISGGIGLFIAFIGFVNGGLVISHPATLVGAGPMNASTITFIIGILITSLLLIRKFKGAFLIGIMVTTIIAFPIGRWWGDASSINFGVKTLVTWSGLFSAPNFELFGQLDLLGSLKFAFFPVIFAFIFTDMFDSLSTFIGVAEAADLKDENGDPRNIKQSLIVDSLATIFSAIFGTSSATSYIESAAGIKAGGRTGVTAIVAAILFMPLIFLSPLISMIPSIATAPILVLVGIFMMTPILKINWSDFEEAVPAFLSFILIPLTYSISTGIIWGFLSYGFIKLFNGKYKEVSPFLWIINLCCICALILTN